MFNIKLVEEIQQNIYDLKSLAQTGDFDFSVQHLKAQVRGITLNLENNIEMLIKKP